MRRKNSKNNNNRSKPYFFVVTANYNQAEKLEPPKGTFTTRTQYTHRISTT